MNAEHTYACWQLEAGGWRLEAGSWKLEADEPGTYQGNLTNDQ